MHFQLEKVRDSPEWYEWTLEQADGTVLARGPEAVAEDDARKQIAAFRKSAGGVKFAKVLK